MVAGVYGLLTWVWSSLVNSEGVNTYAMTFQLFFLRNSWRDFFSVVDVVGHIDGENFFVIHHPKKWTGGCRLSIFIVTWRYVKTFVCHFSVYVFHLQHKDTKGTFWDTLKLSHVTNVGSLSVFFPPVYILLRPSHATSETLKTMTCYVLYECPVNM